LAAGAIGAKFESVVVIVELSKESIKNVEEPCLLTSAEKKLSAFEKKCLQKI